MGNYTQIRKWNLVTLQARIFQPIQRIPLRYFTVLENPQIIANNLEIVGVQYHKELKTLDLLTIWQPGFLQSMKISYFFCRTIPRAQTNNGLWVNLSKNKVYVSNSDCHHIASNCRLKIKHKKLPLNLPLSIEVRTLYNKHKSAKSADF